MALSFIHPAFEPLPYLILGSASIATGLVLELWAVIRTMRRPSRVLPCRSPASKGRPDSSPRPSRPSLAR
jgi:hypothetical protein